MHALSEFMEIALFTVAVESARATGISVYGRPKSKCIINAQER